MKNTSATVRYFVFILLLAGIFSSCVPRKKLLYLHTSDDDTITGKIYSEKVKEHLIKPGNSLYIRLISPNPELSPVTSSMSFSAGYDAGIYLQSYSVNDSGYINMIMIGDVLVKDKTVEEAAAIIQKEVDKNLKGVSVIVKLVNFNVSVLGEVIRPGKYTFYQNKVNILEALGMAGDLTTYAKRDELLLIRQTDSGSEIFTLNLQEANILSSEFYYLQPNDVIYAKPLKGKSFLFGTFPYTIAFGTITTILLVINLLK